MKIVDLFGTTLDIHSGTCLHSWTHKHMQGKAKQGKSGRGTSRDDNNQKEQ